MTEEQAKNKWCPFVGQRQSNGAEVEKCLASNCACWVWDHKPGWVVGNTDGTGNADSVPKGHCGLIK